MTDIERIVAIEEIKNLKARYFRCMDYEGLGRLSGRLRPARRRRLYTGGR